ncbi:hypothetical protein WJX84_005404 [Apatococcus fuscideae]|uniref:thiamine diphosphokinase n=1 Tax=Apatococcus fuscideae TaxID=2026836 RepID=A0AAW1T578_9CHLO
MDPGWTRSADGSLAWSPCAARMAVPLQLASPYLSGKVSASAPPLVLLVLNYKLPRTTINLWHQASLRICADGGANRLYDEVPRLLDSSSEESDDEIRGQYLPQSIRGDLDSVRGDVRDFYAGKGVEITDLAADQDSTDLQKCLHAVEEVTKLKEWELQACNILAVGALGGRLDHTISNLAMLHRFSHLQLTLCGDGNLARLIQRGRTIIHVDPQTEGPQCALFPLCGPATASTTGLRWNLGKSFQHRSDSCNTG